MDRKFILVGIDHTVAQSWRRDDISHDWTTYHQDSINDEPVHDMVGLVHAMRVNFTIIGISQRPQKYWPMTIGWLTKHNVGIDQVLMRPDDDYRASAVVKVDMAARRFDGADKIRDHVAMVIDHHEEVINSFVGLGVTALQIRPRKWT